jgi:hypothetical protein
MALEALHQLLCHTLTVLPQDRLYGIMLSLSLRMDSSDRLISINWTLLASAISLLHSSRHLMWMDCTTAGQTVLYHALFICIAHLRLDSSDRLITNWPFFGLRDLLTSLQSTSNVDGCTTTGQTVRYHVLIIFPVHLRLDFSYRLIKINWPLFGLRDLLTSLHLTSNSETWEKDGLLNDSTWDYGTEAAAATIQSMLELLGVPWTKGVK